MNKMFKKIVATTAAVSTVACLSVSAFAAPTATYTKDTNSVAVTNYGELTETAQYTIIVVPKDWDGEDDTKIYYINQDAGTAAGFGAILAKAALKDGIPNGTYQVRFGTDAATAIEAAEFTIGDDGIKFIWGDTNNDGEVAIADATAIMMRGVGGTTTFGDFTIGVEVKANGPVWGDTNNDGEVAIADATAIMMRGVGGTTTFGDYTIGVEAIVK